LQAKAAGALCEIWPSAGRSPCLHDFRSPSIKMLATMNKLVGCGK
jgi:hypothetical protein